MTSLVICLLFQRLISWATRSLVYKNPWSRRFTVHTVLLIRSESYLKANRPWRRLKNPSWLDSIYCPVGKKHFRALAISHFVERSFSLSLLAFPEVRAFFFDVALHRFIGLNPLRNVRCNMMSFSLINYSKYSLQLSKISKNVARALFSLKSGR